MVTKTCRCGKPIVLFRLHPRGNRLPFDARPVSICVFGSELRRVKENPDASHRPPPRAPDQAEWGRIVQAWMPHHATCSALRAERDAERAQVASKGGRA